MLSRWATGASRPSLEALEEVVSAAGFVLDVRLISAEPKLVELVHDQLDQGPTERLKGLSDSGWPACRDGLRAAAAAGDLAVLVGPVAAALSGAPQRPGSGRVDLLVPEVHREGLADRLLAFGAQPAGLERTSAGTELRERWLVGDGQLTVRWVATGIEDVVAVCDRAHPVLLNKEDASLVRLALVEDLTDLAEHSPWSEDALYRAGLRAVLASGRYSSRKAREERLELA
jgi:hypothetical protein